MASTRQWLAAARPKTLPASLAPVIMGIGAALGLESFSFVRSVLALLIALGFQIGVNFSNDYSDGIRGTDRDDHRIGPQRLTGSGAAQPGYVLGAAILFYMLAALSGLLLVILSRAWVFLILGALGVIAGWFYTGGKHPYGYLPGISEAMVFLFFGWLAVLGTLWVQAEQLPWPVWLGATGTGLLSCALLMVNNLRDIPGDREVGKRTWAVMLGDQRSRQVFCIYLLVAWLLAVAASPGLFPRIGIAVLLLLVFGLSARRVHAGAQGYELIACLQQVGGATLLYGVLLAVGWAGWGI